MIKQETNYGKAKDYFYKMQPQEKVNILATADALSMRQCLYAIQRAYNKRYAAEGVSRVFKMTVNKQTKFMEIWRIV